MQPRNIYNVERNVSLTDKISAGVLVDRDELGGRLSSHIIDIPPNAEYPPHEHPSEHVILLLEGDGYMRYWHRDKEHFSKLTAGDVFYVPQNVPHQVGAYSKGAVMIATSVDSKPLTDPERMKIIQK